MAKYLKKFNTHSEYETYIGGQDVILPNVSYCKDNNEVHCNSFSLSVVEIGHVTTADGLKSVAVAKMSDNSFRAVNISGTFFVVTRETTNDDFRIDFPEIAVNDIFPGTAVSPIQAVNELPIINFKTKWVNDEVDGWLMIVENEEITSLFQNEGNQGMWVEIMPGETYETYVYWDSKPEYTL